MPLSVALRASLAIETSCSDLVTSALISWMVCMRGEGGLTGMKLRGNRWNLLKFER